MERAPQKLLVLLACLVMAPFAWAQVQVNGTVYDRSGLRPLPSVSVLSTSGAGTRTDSLGHYHIRLQLTDSIYFSYLGRATPKIGVQEIDNIEEFDMSLEAGVDSLKSVVVLSHDYIQDSIENRREYEKVFDYGRENPLGNMKSNKGRSLGVGLNMDLFFDGKAARRMESMQSRLEWEEREKYIDHRFNIALVKRVTGLESPILDTFMRRFRPDYETLKSFETDWEYYKYIKDEADYFLQAWKKEE
jgi:hypothetical protein